MERLAYALSGFCKLWCRLRREKKEKPGLRPYDDRARLAAPAGRERAPSRQARAAIKAATRPHQPRTVMVPIRFGPAELRGGRGRGTLRGASLCAALECRLEAYFIPWC